MTRTGRLEWRLGVPRWMATGSAFMLSQSGDSAQVTGTRAATDTQNAAGAVNGERRYRRTAAFAAYSARINPVLPA